jgi:uroporphyrinogen decarboxylase
LATRRWLTPAEYREFGTRYDLAVLKAVVGHSAITVLHLHGQDIFFELANRYPIDAVSWHDHETSPGLAEAQSLTDRALIAGLDRTLMGTGPRTAIQAQAHEALVHTKGRGLILAPSCVLPTTVPAEHLNAVCDAVRPPAQAR